MEHYSSSQVTTLARNVVDGGYCVGCGACSTVANSPLRIVQGPFKQYRAEIAPIAAKEDFSANVLEVCPFSGAGPDEDEIGQEHFGADCIYHNRIGYHLHNYVGYVAEGQFRSRGSSGGMATWLLVELLGRRLVDGVIHVKPRASLDAGWPLFEMSLSHSREQILEGAKSRYYPVEMSGALRQVKRESGSYAIVGVPCFIKAVRLLAMHDSELRERIRFCVAIVCGHFKTARFADMLAWQFGIAPGELVSIDFRCKIDGLPANRYGVKAVGQNTDMAATPAKAIDELYGINWGCGLFKYAACDYCDDVLGETADVSVGDAWLPRYVRDGRGNNIVAVRQKGLRDIIERAISEGRLRLDHVRPDDIAQSQDGALRHRREGLAYRLYLADQRGAWRPQKRVQAGFSELSEKERRIQRLRMTLATRSHTAFESAVQQGDFSVFRRLMAPHMKAYDALYRRPLWRRVGSKVRTTARRLMTSSQPKTREGTT